MKLGGGPNTTIDQFPDYMQAQAAVDDAERNLREQPIQHAVDGRPVFLRDLWPGRAEIDQHLKEPLVIGERPRKRSIDPSSAPIRRIAVGKESWLVVPL